MKTILYFGIDPDFFKELKLASEVLVNCEVHQCSPETENLIEHCYILRPHIIFMDASFASTLAEEVRWIKTTPQFKDTLLAALCKDEQEASTSEILLTAGVHLFHLIATASECFFQDCFQIAFGIKIRSQLPRAKNLETPGVMGFFSAIASVSKESFTLETDLELKDSVTLKLPMSDTAIMEISGCTDGGLVSPYMKTYVVKYPFSKPWETLTENSLQPETVETWIDLRENEFDKRKRHLCLFTQNESLIGSLAHKTSFCWYQIFSRSAEAYGKLYQTRPGVIFYDLPGLEGPDLNQLTDIMRAVREIDSPPMIVIFGSKSDSYAMRKIFDYDYILSVPSRMDLQIFHSFEKVFLAKSTPKEEQYFLRPDDSDRKICLEQSVILTSITERNVTFISMTEIPYFSVARIQFPISAYVTIIPLEGELPTIKRGYHYSAILHGMSEAGLAQLRKTVGQVIQKSITTLTRENLEVMLKQDYLPTPLETVPDPVWDQRAEAVGWAEESQGRFNLKRNFKGKSKQ